MSELVTVTCSTALPPENLRRHLGLAQQIDGYHQFHPDADTRSGELAAYCGVSPRTMQNATKSVRGMSAHRDLRLRKRWSVRRILTMGRPDTVISDVARANSFRHVGEFAGAYRSTFGAKPRRHWQEVKGSPFKQSFSHLRSLYAVPNRPRWQKRALSARARLAVPTALRASETSREIAACRPRTCPATR